MATTSVIKVRGLEKFGELVESLAECYVAHFAKAVELNYGMDRFLQRMRRLPSDKRKTMFSGVKLQRNIHLITSHLVADGVQPTTIARHRDALHALLGRIAIALPILADLLNIAEDLAKNGGELVEGRGLQGIIDEGPLPDPEAPTPSPSDDEDDEDEKVQQSSQLMLPFSDEEEDDAAKTPKLTARKRPMRLYGSDDDEETFLPPKAPKKKITRKSRADLMRL